MNKDKLIVQIDGTYFMLLFLATKMPSVTVDVQLVQVFIV